MICSKTAKVRGRSPQAWFFMGVAFGLLSLIALYVLPKKNKAIKLAPVIGSTQLESSPIREPNLEGVHSTPESITFWYYLDEANNQYGPMSGAALKGAWDDDKISSKTYVWNEQMENWKTLENLPDLLKKVRRIPENY